MKVALYVGGAALLLIAGYAVYSMTQTTQTQAAAPGRISTNGQAESTNTSSTGGDRTLQDWNTAIGTGTQVVNTVSSILDKWL